MVDFYLDNDVSRELAVLLGGMGHHVTMTRDLRHFRAGDDAQLLTATHNRWVLLTFNRRDFVMLHDAWITWPAAFGIALPAHPGILVLDPVSATQLASVIVTLLAKTRDGPLANNLFWWHRHDGWRRRNAGVGWESYS